jgi:hypothetical protein
LVASKQRPIVDREGDLIQAQPFVQQLGRKAIAKGVAACRFVHAKIFRGNV